MQSDCRPSSRVHKSHPVAHPVAQRGMQMPIAFNPTCTKQCHSIGERLLKAP